MSIVNLNIFNSNMTHGNMNTASRFYSEGMTKEEIKKDFLERRIKLGKEFGFDGKSIIIPTQKNSNNSNLYPDGTYKHIKLSDIAGYDDLYDLDVPSDILMIDQNMPGIAIAYPVADCPVVIAKDIKKCAASLAHCGGEYIDRKLPQQVIDSLRKEYDSDPRNIIVYIGPHAHKESYYNEDGQIPTYVKNESNWDGCLEEDKKGRLHISLAKAIVKQLYEEKIPSGNICISNIDTITNHLYYSNRASKIDKEKSGRFYVGCFYEISDNDIHK